MCLLMERSYGQNMMERNREKRKQGDGQKAFYGNEASSGLSPLFALERLFVHDHFRITQICPPPHTHIQNLHLKKNKKNNGFLGTNSKINLSW